MSEDIREKFIRIVKERKLGSEEVLIQAKPLTPEEAIGNPEDSDYPILKGKERLMQATFRGAFGQAFTDMYGNYQGKLSDIITMDLKNNFRRAIFVSTLNAVLRYLGLAEGTVHCKDKDPPLCSQKLVPYIRGKYDPTRVALVGFQPRMAEELSRCFKLRIIDMDENNIGKEKFGIKIEDPSKTTEILKWCDLALITGTTVVNETTTQLETSKPAIFYGVTIAGVAYLLGLDRFCPYGT